MNCKGILVVVSGFSGAGKGTVMKQLISDYDNYALSISKTTRAPRTTEVNGREYFFTDQETFQREIEQEGFLEYANYVGNYYGTPRAYVEEQIEKGKDVILEIEIQGALSVKEKFPEALLLFVMPPSAKDLEKRLKGRGTENDEEIAKRIKRAGEESEGIEKYEYIVVNDELEGCVKQVHEIIQIAKCASSRNLEFIENMRNEILSLH